MIGGSAVNIILTHVFGNLHDRKFAREYNYLDPERIVELFDVPVTEYEISVSLLYRSTWCNGSISTDSESRCISSPSPFPTCACTISFDDVPVCRPFIALNAVACLTVQGLGRLCASLRDLASESDKVVILTDDDHGGEYIGAQVC